MQPCYVKGLPAALAKKLLHQQSGTEHCRQPMISHGSLRVTGCFSNPPKTHHLPIRRPHICLQSWLSRVSSLNRGEEVVIGDQSGIEHVLHHPGGILHYQCSRGSSISGAEGGEAEGGEAEGPGGPAVS